MTLALDRRFSDMGPDGDALYDARRPAVVYNGADHEYLVVWEADDNTGQLVAGEFEVRAQLIDAITGTPVGADDFRVSHMGPDGDPSFGGFRPSVAWNGTDNQYLVVWYGDDDSLGLADEEFEIYGQLLDASGLGLGPAFRISAMGGDGNPAFFARDPRVAYNSVSHEYLVVWEGEDNLGGLVAGETEIFGQFLDPSGLEIGPDDFRISDMGPNGHPGYDAFNPAVAHNPLANQYLVVWEGDDNTGGLVGGEFEIFGQLVAAATGQEVGADFRVSVTGPDGASQYDAINPSVACNDDGDEYLVAWEADGPPLPDGKFEIRGQRIDAASSARLEAEDFLISAMGEPDDPDYDAEGPSVTCSADDDTCLVVWHGDSSSGSLVDNELEIYGRLVTFPLAGSQFRLSDLGTSDGNNRFDARWPAAACNPDNGEFLVVWEGDDDTGALVDDELEIYGQRLAATALETGTNDFRISSAGGEGDHAYDAGTAAVAYNAIDNEYLVVWEGDDDTDPLVDGEQEIFGQRVDALTGAEVGLSDFRISDMGPDGDPIYEAGEPQVAWNSVDNRYLVVWEGDDDTGPFVDEEFEVHGQLIDGATGREIGADFRISDVGPDGLPSRDAGVPAVAYDPIANRFLVVWEADDTDVGTPNHKNEIHGQLLDGATGAEVGPNDFRISDMGQNDDPEFDGREPAVAFNPVDHEYLVVWRGEDDTGGLVFDEFEIFGQRIDAATGAELGLNDFRLSDMGPDGDTTFNAHSPAVAHNASADQYLVVWRSDDDSNGLADEEFEIFGQRLDGATGAEIGANDFRISDMGPDGDPAYGVREPSMAWSEADNEYLVAWEGTDNGTGLGPDKSEIFVQRIDANGAEVGENDLRASHTGEDGDADADATDPGIAWGSARDQFLVAWGADPATGATVDNENEIYGACLGGFPCQGDLDGDGEVGVVDFLSLLKQWGTDPGGPPDLDGDGTVGVIDFLSLLKHWGPCP